MDVIIIDVVVVVVVISSEFKPREDLEARRNALVHVVSLPTEWPH